MNPKNSRCKARYDSQGNIVLEPYLVSKNEEETPKKHDEEKSDIPMQLWKTCDDEKTKKCEMEEKKTETLEHHPLPGISERLKSGVCRVRDTSSATWKGVHQEMRDSYEDLRKSVKIIQNGAHEKAEKLIDFLSMPLDVPSRKNGRLSRGPLARFTLDAVRFGATFAALFIVLFSAMNFQSFLQIAKAQLALGSEVEKEQALQSIVQGSAIDHTHSESRVHENDLIAYLPSVGPQENRIIIPKIGKNLPIVQPSMDALMKEDWKKFEEDIQEALLSGVVHYPGSAKPGNLGNAFFTAHSSYFAWSKSKHKDDFARLGELEVGDMFSVYYNGDKFTYRVFEKKEVKPTDVSVLDQPTDRKEATLMTCTPVGTTLRRLIVRAEAINPDTGKTVAADDRAAEKTSPIEKLHHDIEMLPI